MGRMRMKRCISLLLCLLFCASALLPAVLAGYERGYAGGMAGDDCGIYAHGVDLSNWQGHSVDFNKIKAQGYGFVILRAGFATTKDDTFEENYARAKAAGLDVGVYLYSYAGTVEEAKKEAAALKTWLRDKVLEYPVYYDIEEPSIHAKMTPSELTALAMAFLDDVAADGWLVGLYSCKSWLDARLETQKICAKYECWMAQYLSDGTYNVYDRYDGLYGMWQYSSSGSVDGVPGSTDMNVCFKDYPEICRRYGFNGYAATGESLWLSGMTAPSVMVCGGSFPVQGRVTSADGVLTNVTVGVYDETGARVTGGSAVPRTESFDLSSLAGDVRLSKLKSGRYELRITATNDGGEKTLLKQSLAVSEAGVRLDDAAIPVDLKQGDVFKPTGILLAATQLQEVRVRVCNEKGAQVCAAAAAPESETFDLAELPEAPDLAALTLGSYTYRIEATTPDGSETLLQVDFSVWVRNDPVTLSGFTMQAEYRPQELSGLTGVVSSERSALRYVRVTILDRTGAQIRTAQTERQKKQVLLQEFRRELSLETLPVGTYTCRVEALNDGGPCLVAQQSFLVRSDAVSLCGLSAPYCLHEGDTFFLDGMVASDFSRLLYVGVTVTDAEGRLVLDAAAVPQGSFCDLGSASRGPLFSTLPAGRYTLKITAQNGEGYHVLYCDSLTVTKNDDPVCWEGEHFALADTAFYAGDGIPLWGTLTSAHSDITAVTAEVLNAEGNLVTKARRVTNTRSFDVSEFQQMLRFSALPKGSYFLRIRAENASGETVLCNERFCITDCPHRNACSGEVYAATCTSRGVICDSRCLDCGAKTRNGRVLETEQHTFQDGVCTQCGRTDYLPVHVRAAQELRKNGRYVLAVSDGSGFYALDAAGKAVRIYPDEDGAFTVSAALLWTPAVKDGGVLCLVNASGERLHLDSAAVSMGAGSMNSVLFAERRESGFTLSLKEDRTRCLSFADGEFTVSRMPCEILFLEMSVN